MKNRKNIDPQMVTLRTEEPAETVERLVPISFAMSQFNAGYDKIQVIDPDNGVILFEHSCQQ